MPFGNLGENGHDSLDRPFNGLDYMRQEAHKTAYFTGPELKVL